MDREPTATRIPIDTRDDPVLNRAQKIRDTEYSNRTNELHNLLMQSLPNVTVGTPFADGFMPILTKGAKIWTRVLQQGFSLLIHPESTDIPLDYDHYHRVLDELGLSYHHRQSKNGEFIRTQCGDSETLVKSLKVLTKEI